jgi:DedD protein
VERQLKERLIGAAVLMAVAVVMVPEMFSGPHSHSEPAADSSSASSGQIKTYHIQLQSAHSSEPQSQPAIEAPAAQPRDEAPVPANDGNLSEPAASASAASSSSSRSRTQIEPVPAVTKPVAKPAPPAPIAVPNTPTADSSKPVDGDWVVQVGSFGAEDKARQIVSKLKGQGYPAYLGQVTVSGKTLYRVRVGAMPSRAAAEASLQKIKATYPAASVVPADR